MKRLLLACLILLFSSSAWANVINVQAEAFGGISGLKQSILKLGLRAYDCAMRRGEVHKPILTIVDYTLPSYEKRMWVLDVNQHKVLFHLFVAHGHNSGLTYARHFSNAVNSHESSLGVMITGESYYGKHGYSLRLHGLEKGINNNVYRRDIVMHSAWYVNAHFVHEYDRLGRSWGCLAISPKEVHQVISTIKDGSVILAYAPREQNDPYITHCPLAKQLSRLHPPKHNNGYDRWL